MIQSSHYTIPEVRDAHESLLMADRHRDAGEINQAEKIYSLLLEQNPDYTAALKSLGKIHSERQDWAAAYPHLLRAAMLNPRDWSILFNLGKVYIELDATESAVRCLERALLLNPEDPKILYFLGIARHNQYDYTSAAEFYRRSLAKAPAFANAALQLASCYVEMGRFDDATQTLTTALQMRLSRDQGAEAYYLLSKLPAVPSGMDLLEAIENLGPAQKDGWEVTPRHIAYARGTMLHKAGRFEEAWDCWTNINRQIADDTEAQRKTFFDWEKRHLKKAMGWRRSKLGTPELQNSRMPTSIYILGTSRAGKTTLERLIAPVGGIKVGEEYEIASFTATIASQRAGLLTENVLANLPKALNNSISDIYHSKLKAVAGEARALTLTNPGAIFDVGRLTECVPNARFVFLKREVDDIALRIFSKLYPLRGNLFAYNIPDIYKYISQYYQLIDKWLEKLGDKAMLIQYEDMVDDPQSTLTRVAEFCDLKLPSDTSHKIYDDRGCSDPYRKWLHAARDGTKS